MDRTTVAAPIVGPEGPPSVGELRKAIPAHLFERSLFGSFPYLVADLLEVAIATWLAVTFIEPVNNVFLSTLLWTAYACYQGTTMFGLWILGHECGHGAFSSSGIINNVVGFVLHSCLYVPYYSWAFSHASHHKHTNHVGKDEVFVPYVLAKGDPLPPRPSALRTFLVTVFMVVVGWPIYLATNMSGPIYEGKGIVSHFDPWSPLFRDGERWKIVVTDAGLVAVTAALAWLGSTFGIGLIARLYGAPMIIVYFWLVSVTILQHTDPRVSHFDENGFTWLRGALSTIDRPLGAFLDYKVHHITDSHVVHHLFSAMPFYHAIEATPHVKAALGKYYVDAGGSGLFYFLASLWRSQAVCHSVWPADKSVGEGVLTWAPFSDAWEGMSLSLRSSGAFAVVNHNHED